MIFQTSEPCRAFIRGVSAGYIESKYIEKAEKMRNAANEQVDYLGYVQNV